MIGLLLTNCVKDKVEQAFAGTYDCEKVYSYTDNSGNDSSSSEQVIVEVTLENDSLDVLGAKVHEDEVEYGKTISESYISNYINYRFEPDSIYITLHYGSSGSNSTTHYAGRKIK